MDLIVGVVHAEEFIDIVDDYLKERYPSGIESMMLEIPSNWKQVRYRFMPNDPFFLELDKRYKSKHTKIIYGDVPIDTSKPFTWVDVLVDRLFTHNRDKTMNQTANTKNPQVVVVGNDHANYIKRRNSGVPYVTFRAKPLSIGDSIVEWMLGRPYQPEEVIKLTYKHPREYYLRKHGIIS